MKKLYIFGIIVASLTVLYLPFVAHAQIGAQYPNGFNRVQGKGDFDKYSYDYSVWCNVASDVGGILSIDRSSASTDTYTCAPASASTYYSAKQFPSSYFAQKENSSRILCNYENGGTGGVYSTKRDQYIDHYYCKKSGSSSSGGTGSGGTTSSGGSIGAQYPNGFNRVQGKGDFDKYSYDYSVWCNVASDVGGILSIDRSSASTDTYTCAPASASTYYSAKQFPSSYFAQKENSSRILCNYENGGTGGVYSTKRDQYIDHYYCKKSGSSSSGGTGSGGTTSSGGSTGTGTSPSTGSGSSSGTGGLGNKSLAEMTVTVPSLGVFSDIGTYLSTLITRYGIPFAVMAALIFIMYAGWHYIHSGGSPEGQKLAKELIVGALLGLLVLFMIGYALTVIIPQEELNSSGTTGQANGATITVKLPAQIKSLKGKLSGN